MAIYWGSYEDAIESAAEGWQIFPFQRGQTKENFSQVLFRARGFPEVQSDFESNITMHQMLRLIYVDQITAVDALMRREDFDSALIRETVGHLLFGIYDDSLYSAEISLRKKQKEVEKVKREIDGLLQVFDTTSKKSTSML